MKSDPGQFRCRERSRQRARDLIRVKRSAQACSEYEVVILPLASGPLALSRLRDAMTDKRRETYLRNAETALGSCAFRFRESQARTFENLTTGEDSQMSHLLLSVMGALPSLSAI